VNAFTHWKKSIRMENQRCLRIQHVFHQRINSPGNALPWRGALDSCWPNNQCLLIKIHNQLISSQIWLIVTRLHVYFVRKTSQEWEWITEKMEKKKQILSFLCSLLTSPHIPVCIKNKTNLSHIVQQYFVSSALHVFFLVLKQFNRYTQTSKVNY